MRLRVLALPACAVLLLSACGSSSSGSTSDSTSDTRAPSSTTVVTAPSATSGTDTESATSTTSGTDAGTTTATDTSEECVPGSSTAASSDTMSDSTADVAVDPAQRTIPEVHVPATPPTELVINDEVAGSGPAATDGNLVTFNYVVALQCDGTVIDDNYGTGQPLTFVLGTGQVIPGFDQGLVGVQAGTRRQVDIPSDLAYGPTGREPIPPNAALTFIVDVLDVTDPTVCPAVDRTASPVRQLPAYPPTCIDPNANYTAQVSTNQGDFTIELFADKAPLAVNNFVVLARYHFYDGLSCHRIISGFMTQCGDPQGTGSGGPGYQFDDELPEEGAYKIGSVAMANSGPNTNGSQFFVMTGTDTQLPPNYTLFGQVTDGLDTTLPALDAMGDPNANNGMPPREPVTINSITITETPK